jgi:tetratricopeptide (TPR) repeat protein
MKGKGKNLRVTQFLIFACAVILPAVSCAVTADREMIRLYARAAETYAQGRFAETMDILNNVKKFPPALVLRAKAEYFSNELEKAEKSCLLAIKYRPSAFEAKLYLARILREKGELSQAIQLAESLLADNPQDFRSLRLAAELADEAGRSEEAVALLDKAAELSAECALVLLDRARQRWVAGRGPEALEDLSRARAMLPWDTPLARSIENLETRIREALL